MKRNVLTSAVVAGLTGVVGLTSIATAQVAFDVDAQEAASGIAINPDGLGEVLLYPYYTARGGNNTLISVINTSDQYVVAKVRFLEALNSREVLDFNLYMSPFDVWTTAVVEEEGVFGIQIADSTCTAPVLQPGEDEEYVFQEFLNFEYIDAPSSTNNRFDYGPQSDDRMGSGYLEIIEMGVVLDGGAGSVGRAVRTGVKHSATTGIPADCDAPTDAWLDEWDEVSEGATGDRTTDIGAPIGALAGSASIVDVAEGTMFGYDPVALVNFWASDAAQERPVTDDDTWTTVTGGEAHVRPGSIYPSLRGAVGVNDAGGLDFAGNTWTTAGTAATLINWDTTEEAVSATLSKNSLLNEFVIDGIAFASTEWVVTFPTKRFHTDGIDSRIGLTAPIPPFTELWETTGTTTLSLDPACEAVDYTFFDRDERTFEPEPGDIIVSPPPPVDEEPEFTLCREANVLRIASSELSGATELLGEIGYAGFTDLDVTNFNTTPFEDAGDFTTGWFRITMNNSGNVMESVAVTVGDLDVPVTRVTGLPVIGFAAQRFFNGTAANTLRNYGTTFEHKGTRSIFQSSGG